MSIVAIIVAVVLAFLAFRLIAGVIFISGDRHLCEVTAWPADRGAGYTLWDITSSPLANRTFREGGGLPNKDRVFLNGETNNFGWIEVDADARLDLGREPHAERSGVSSCSDQRGEIGPFSKG